ncbi:hypothetical protein KUV85_11640 [Nocardioides panacisoli]|uniref:hypothetical protein n=1 Tax=Nocardioides panacisoli TaxID=627624 RepID=UPI001C62A921|nr:hypothetical protein [Nocardioides panacisoli]QYJ02986.1 hypothetical protein KUV85_11640 [Nocardioides panacisoli]
MRRACAFVCSLFIALVLQWGVADPATAKKAKPAPEDDTTTSEVQDSSGTFTGGPSTTMRVHGSW